MKLPKEEEEAFKKLCAIAKTDQYIIKQVLASILIMMELALYKGEDEIIIPYIGKFKFASSDINTRAGKGTKVEINIEPSSILVNEFSSIIDDEPTQALQYYQKEVIAKLCYNLEEDESWAKELIKYFNLEEDNEVDA